jgi:hypothetical protein
MEDSSRYRGYWFSRVGLVICGVVGLSLAGLGVLLSEALQSPRRLLGPGDLLRLNREAALQVLTMDESLVESYRGLLRSALSAVFVAAALALLATVLGGIGIFRSRRQILGAGRGLPSSEGSPKAPPSGVPNSR